MLQSKYVKEIKGNALAFPDGTNLLIHCANCFCTMGSGIAMQVKSIFPKAFEADCETESGDESKLGTYTIARVNHENKTKFIVNLYGQFQMGSEKRHVNYEAIATGLESLYERLSRSPEKIKVSIPKKMASDRAGGEWDIVEQMIHVFAEKFEVETLIVEYNG